MCSSWKQDRGNRVNPVKAVKRLEEAALDAPRSGEPWADFHRRHSVEMNRAEPIDHRAYHRLVCRLMALVVSGDTDGQTAVGDDDAMPRLLDEQQEQTPSDTGTAARIDWQAAGIGQEPTT